MSNQVFVLANDDGSHIFGGLSSGALKHSALSCGIDFGGDVGIDNQGEVSAQNSAKSLIVIPVSEKTADRFRAFVDIFVQMHKEDRLPFYFKREGFARQLEEKDLPPLDVYGNSIENLNQSLDFADVRYRVRADTSQTDSPLKLPGRMVRANCLTFLSLVARMSGIDLERLHSGWRGMQRGAEATAFFREAFNNAACPVQIERGLSYELRESIDSSSHRALVIRHLDPVPGKRVMTFDLVDALACHYGGFGNLVKAVQDWPPFDAEPFPVPEYLKKPLIDAGFDIS